MERTNINYDPLRSMFSKAQSAASTGLKVASQKASQGTVIASNFIQKKKQEYYQQNMGNQRGMYSHGGQPEEEDDDDDRVFEVDVSNSKEERSLFATYDDKNRGKEEFKKMQNPLSAHVPNPLMQQEKPQIQKQQEVVEEVIILGEIPDPETAPNEILKELFEQAHKYLKDKKVTRNLQNMNFLLQELNKPKIDLKKVKELSFRGIADEIPILRPIIWRLLLDVYPCEPAKWQEEQENKQKSYQEFKENLIIKPSTLAQDDHPLSTNTDSKWSQFYKDQELWEEIEKDVKRTRTDVSFFWQAVDQSKGQETEKLLSQQQKRKGELTAEEKANYIETHSDVLSRILFLYSKLNSCIRYVQGMNEIAAVLYFCFHKFKSQKENLKHLESDLFFAFTSLMAEIRDGFQRDLDKESTGIKGKVSHFYELLEVVEPKMHEHLDNQGINPQFYALRWIMLLLCQEFDMVQVLRLWDTLFSDQQRFEYLNYVCIAQMKRNREGIMDEDFAVCMESLQGSAKKTTDVRALLNDANQVARQFSNTALPSHL